MKTINEVNIHDLIENGRFGGHETFTPRYGWLKKGFDAFKDGNVFNREDAIERLGVGKNMVRSIRHWCRAFKVIAFDEEKGKEDTPHLAELLFEDDGWDPYLEDIGSLWLLHYHLFLPRLESLGHVLMFNNTSLEVFDIQQLSDYLQAAGRNYSRFNSISKESFHREASCLIRMYAEGASELELECPFTQLRLLIPGDRHHTYAFNIHEKPTLPPLILLACCLLYMRDYLEPTVRTISVQRLATGLNSPGVAFKLTETILGNALEQALGVVSGVTMEYAAGSLQLHIIDDNSSYDDLIEKILNKYYEKEE